MNFQDFNLKESLLKALSERGYTEPTGIQEEALPGLLEADIDFIGQAQTGTGKTAAFSLPLLNKIDKKDEGVQAIILAPTRELACQVALEIEKFSVYEKISTVCVYGGISIEGQIRDIKRKRPHIIVGTPGRVLDLIHRKILNLSSVRFAILDEADEMLNMGFIDDVREILSQTPDTKNTWMFSATLPPQILDLINTFLSNPLVVKVKNKTLSNESIEQVYAVVRPRERVEAVERIIDASPEMYGIIFTRTRMEAKDLSDSLISYGLPTDALHGDMSQAQRDQTMKRFKEKKLKLLVCTDVAARGIDVDNLTHVINYGLPQDLEAYVHRIGRTGRAGAKGMAITLIDPSEKFRLRHVERLTRATLKPFKLPTGADLVKGHLEREAQILKELLTQLAQGGESDQNVLDIENSFFELFKEDDKDALLRVLYRRLTGEKVGQYLKAREIGVRELSMQDNNSRSYGRPGDSRGQLRVQGPSGNRDVRFFLNIGRDHGANLKDILNTISSSSRVKSSDIRRVDIKDGFTFLEVPTRHTNDILNLGGIEILGKKIRFEVANSSGNSFGGVRPRNQSRSYGGGGARGDQRGDQRRDQRGKRPIPNSYSKPLETSF